MDVSAIEGESDCVTIVPPCYRQMEAYAFQSARKHGKDNLTIMKKVKTNSRFHIGALQKVNHRLEI